MIISRTPFRISFFGGCTDYPVWYEKNGGATLSTTIDKYCYITARYYPPFFPIKHRIVWSKIETVKNDDEIEHPSVRETLKYLGIKKGVEIHHNSDLPARSGLGSSSSFTVGLLHALYKLLDQPVTKLKLASDAIHVEQERIKENVGSQDQLAAAFGGFNKFTFGGPQKIGVEPIILSDDRLETLQKNLMLVFTGFARTASEVVVEQLQNTPYKDRELRIMHAMVDDALKILRAPHQDLSDFGKLLHETWMLKRSLSSKVTNAEIDNVYESARRAGAIGGKLLGAGSGGFMLLFVPPERQSAVHAALKDHLFVPFKFETGGSQIIYHQNSGHLA